jgi:hypothetical protein
MITLSMRVYRIVMCSGVNIDIMASVMVDDPAASESISFYQDEAFYHLVATVKRSQVAGLILSPKKASTMPIPFPR